MLQKIRLVPGLDKQSSDTGAEGKWVNADYTRFRYGFPEKIGGWEQLVSSNLIGAGRDQHTWVDLAGNKYAAIGTNKCLYIYFEGEVYDITPLDTTRQQTGVTFSMTNTSTTVTLTTSTAHDAEAGDIILLDSAPSGFDFTYCQEWGLTVDDDVIDRVILDLRKKAYPSWEDQLDYIYHNGVEDWKTNIITPIKEKYPKRLNK